MFDFQQIRSLKNFTLKLFDLIYLRIDPFFNEDETPLFIGFLASEGSGQDGCLNRAACQSPQTAEEYLKAARALMKSAEIFDTDYLNMNTTSYSKLIYQVEQSIKEGKDGAPCDTIYSCRI